jgi:hypothetical protein
LSAASLSRRHGPKGRAPVILLALALALVGAGIAAAVVEIGPYFVAGYDSRDKAAALESGVLRPGLSFDSEELVLEDCAVAMRSLLLRASPTERRRQVLSNCLAIADGIVAGAPGMAHAWLVGARAAAELGDDAGLASRLATGRERSPNEGWLAQARVALAEDNIARLQPSDLAGHRNDIAVLIAGNRFADAVIARYLREPGFRDRVRAALETLPTKVQRRFLDRLRAASGGTGP